MAHREQRMAKEDKNLLKDLVEISKYFGQRFDLTQAAGGNSSIKIGKKMYIKSSGYSLSEVTYKNGYTILNNNKLIDYLYKVENKKINSYLERQSAKILKDSVIKGGNPSIETFAHSLMKKYAIHIHPIATNMVSVNKQSEKIFNKIFKKRSKDVNLLYVKYKNPGISLANEIMKNLVINKEILDTNKPIIVFLENHGLICSSDYKSELIETVEKFVRKFENYLKLDFKRYKQTTEISKILWENSYKDLVSYYSEDSLLGKLIHLKNSKNFVKPLNPDQLLYCGESPLIVKSSLEASIKAYIGKNRTYPRVIIIKKSVYFIAWNVLKAKEREDVFKAHLYFNSTKKLKRTLKNKDIKNLESYNLFKNRLRFWFDYIK